MANNNQPVSANDRNITLAAKSLTNYLTGQEQSSAERDTAADFMKALPKDQSDKLKAMAKESIELSKKEKGVSAQADLFGKVRDLLEENFAKGVFAAKPSSPQSSPPQTPAGAKGSDAKEIPSPDNSQKARDNGDPHKRTGPVSMRGSSLVAGERSFDGMDTMSLFKENLREMLAPLQGAMAEIAAVISREVKQIASDVGLKPGLTGDFGRAVAAVTGVDDRSVARDKGADPTSVAIQPGMKIL